MNCELSDDELLNLTESQALELAGRLSREELAWALLRLSALAQRKKPAADPATPSSQIPPYEKPSPKTRAKTRGRKDGHPGARRAAPGRIDRRVEHSLEVCPDCGAPVHPARRARRRVIQDLAADTRVETTEHVIHSHYCPQCRTRVEPKVLDALPKSMIGNRALALTAWLHYGLGQTISQIAEVLSSLFQCPISPGALSQQWARLSGILALWYEQIAAEARAGAVLHADETGWRNQGRSVWLWCFTAPTLTYYVIDPSRSSRVVNDFLQDCYDGTLVSDFFSAYNCVAVRERQVCLVHLLRELKKVDASNASDEWIGFRSTLKRLLKDALRLGRRADRQAPDYLSKRRCIQERYEYLVAASYDDPDARRLLKRLIHYRAALFTFLDNPDVPADNNHAEREIRPAVIARKNSFHNTSDHGAQTQAILMSIYRTLKRRGCDPLKTIEQSLRAYIETGALPPLPQGSSP